MAVGSDTAALDRLLGPLAECFTPAVAKSIASVRAAPDVQARLDELADKCTEDRLTDQERVEYESYVRALDVIAILQAKARALVSSDRNA